MTPPPPSEHPTEPDGLRPPSLLPLTLLPVLPSPPTDLLASIGRLPAPNPESYIEMSIATLLVALERQTALDRQIDNAVTRLNEDADKRQKDATAEVTKNIELTNREVKNLARRLGDLETVVREMAPLGPSIDELKGELKALAIRLGRMEHDVRALEGKHATNPPAFPTMPGKPARKTNPGK